MSVNRLGTNEISEIEAIVRESITRRDKRQIQTRNKLNIPGNLLEIIIYQILAPIITSICANFIYDHYKNKAINSLSVKESKEIIKKCTDKPAKDKLEIPEQLRSDMEKILEEYGNDPEMMDYIVNKVNDYLSK